MISNILTNKSVWKILILYSYGQGIGYSWSELRKFTHLQIKSLKIALNLLYFYKILRKEKRIIKLDLSNSLSRDLMKLIDIEKKRFNFPDYQLYLALIIMLEKVQKEQIDEIYLFGSHAKKTASVNSDIDIAIVSKDMNLSLTKEQVEIEEKFGHKFEFHILNKKSQIFIKEIKIMVSN